MTTRSTKALHRVVMMASAFIVTQTVNLSIALAKPGIIDRAKQKAHDVKEGVEKGVEAAKDGAEMYEKGKGFGRHAEQFWAGTGLTDLVGRSIWQILFIAMFGLGLALLLYRIRRNKASSVSFWMRFILAYGLAVVVGFGYEMLRTFEQPDKMNTFFLGGAGLVLAGGFLVHYDRWWIGLRAIRARRFRYFLKTFELRPEVVAPPAEEASDDEDEEDETPAQTTCPNCGQETVAGAKYCMFCAVELPTTTPALSHCPNCGQETVPGAKYCMFCAVPLTS